MSMQQSKPPKEGEEIYVSHTQVFGYVLEVGPVRGKSRGCPLWHVTYDRKNNVHEGLVFRNDRGRLSLHKKMQSS